MELELKLEKNTEEKSLADKLAQLTVRIQGGDSEAFSEFFEVSKNYVAAVIRGFDSERASGQLEDIMQDVYIKAFNNIGSVKNPQSTMKWLRTIASSTTKDFFKKKAVKHEDVVKTAPDDENPEDTLESLNAHFLIPEDFVENIAMQEVLAAGIKKLPEKQAYMIFEFYINGGSISDIADELDMTEGAVKTNLSRARKSLQAIFTEMEEKDGIKLRSVGIIPLFLFIFYLLMRANPVSAATSDAVWDGISSSGATGSGGNSGTSGNAGDGTAGGNEAAGETPAGTEAASGTESEGTAKTADIKASGTAAKAASGAAKTAGISAAAKGIIIGAVALVVIAAIAIMAWNTLKTGSTEETTETIIETESEAETETESEAETETEAETAAAVTYNLQEAFAKEGVWFKIKNGSTPDAYAEVYQVVVFDGAGNAAVYDIEDSGTLLGAFDGLTNDEAVSLANNIVKQEYEEQLASTIELLENREISFEFGKSSYLENEDPEYYEELVAYLLETYNVEEDLEYEAPEVSAFVLGYSDSGEMCIQIPNTAKSNPFSSIISAINAFLFLGNDWSQYTPEELVDAACSSDENSIEYSFELNEAKETTYSIGTTTVCGYKYFVTVGIDEYTLE